MSSFFVPKMAISYGWIFGWIFKVDIHFDVTGYSKVGFWGTHEEWVKYHFFKNTPVF